MSLFDKTAPWVYYHIHIYMVIDPLTRAARGRRASPASDQGTDPPAT